MKKVLLYAAALLSNLILETVLFVRLPLGLRPDSVLAVLTAMALVIGGLEAGLYGAGAGLLIGLLVSPAAGAEAIAYFLTAQALGLFTRKYFADNWIFAAGAAAAAYVLDQAMMAVFARLMGSGVSFFSLFLRYLLPSALLTGLLAIPVFLVYRHVQQDRLRRARYE